MSLCLRSLCISLVFSPLLVTVAGTELHPDNETAIAGEYFLKYGYLTDYSAVQDKAVLSSTLRNFQKFAGLQVTGELNEETRKQFETPRCGMSDRLSSKRKRRYLLQGNKWDLSSTKDRTLTWRLENTGSGLSRDDIRAELRKAFNLWQKHGNIKFTETTAKRADILIKFAKVCHSDPFCFDRKGGTLAHAFYPYPGVDISGDVHFDDDETYVIAKSTGTDLLWVATHEIGHSLGLEHSNKRGAIMFPWYQGYKEDFDLTADDVAGISQLYGAAVLPATNPPPIPQTTAPTTVAKTQTVPVTTTREPSTEKPLKTTEATTAPKEVTVKKTLAVTNPTTVSRAKPTRKTTNDPNAINLRFKCTRKINAAFISQKYGWMLVFTKDIFYLANRNGIRHGPINVKRYFPHINGYIDATVENTATGETIIFTGKSFWIYRGFTRQVGPLSLRALGLDGSVNRIDAAFRWKRNGRYYLFSGIRYWRFNPSKPVVDTQAYPKYILDHWFGIPEYLSEAVTDFDGVTRFIKDSLFYTLIDEAVRVDGNSPGVVGGNWMQCRARKAVPSPRRQSYKGPMIAEP